MSHYAYGRLKVAVYLLILIPLRGTAGLWLSLFECSENDKLPVIGLTFKKIVIFCFLSFFWSSEHLCKEAGYLFGEALRYLEKWEKLSSALLTSSFKKADRQEKPSRTLHTNSLAPDYNWDNPLANVMISMKIITWCFKWLCFETSVMKQQVREMVVIMFFIMLHQYIL